MKIYNHQNNPLSFMLEEALAANVPTWQRKVMAEMLAGGEAKRFIIDKSRIDRRAKRQAQHWLDEWRHHVNHK